jgi:hypothetical protein
LTNGAFLDKEIADNGSAQKTKPSMRKGQNPAGPAKSETAELPRDEPLVSSAFLLWRNRIETREVVKRQFY